MLFRCRPSAIARWPAWEVRLVEQFLAKEPDPAFRQETLLATLLSLYLQVHSKEGATVKSAEDFMPHLKAWPEVGGRYSEADRNVLKALI